MNVITNKMKCLECGEEFETRPVWVMGEPVFQKRCEPCVDSLKAERDKAHSYSKLKDFDKKWKLICPPEFRTIEEGGKTDPEILKTGGKGVEDVINWKPGDKSSVAIYSAKSGTMKTRSAWRLINRLMKERSYNLIATSGPEFEQDLREKSKTSMEIEWIQKCKNAEIFFVDDIDKACWSRWGKSVFFSILKSRCEYDKTCIITTNQTGGQWQQTFVQDEFGEPIVRRMNNYFDVIQL